jgi:hypothetical protein
VRKLPVCDLGSVRVSAPGQEVMRAMLEWLKLS